MTHTAQRQRFDKIVAANAPSRERLLAWPTLGRAAEMIGIPASTLTRAADKDGIEKYPFGRRDKKLAPDAVLDLARAYAANVNDVAEQLMVYAEESGAAPRYVNGVEKTIGAWLAGQARSARSTPEEVEAIVAAIREVATPELADAIFARAGLTG